MLKIKCKQLRLSSKGNLKRFIGNGIPVLSIFALVGISFSVIVGFGEAFPAEEAYATDEVFGDSTASITISGSASDETISAGRGSTVYRTHTISIAGNNVKNYILSIYGDNKLSYVENSTTGQLSTTEYLSSANGATGSNLPTNTWGYAYSNNSSTSNANLTYTAPTTNAVTLVSGNIPTSSNGILSITNNKLVFAAKFDEDKPSGNYKANVNLALTITPRVLTTYSITYDCKSGTGCPSNYTESLYEETKTYTIPTTTPTRSGYKFLGYSTNSSATTADANYAPGKAISLTQAVPSVKLYAVWEFIPFSGITTMQQMTIDICDRATENETGQLMDERDNKMYWVTKLRDGHCWMTQNLALDLQDGISLQPETSDVKEAWNPGATSLAVGNGSWNTDNAAIMSLKSGDSYYGNYYTWCAATAGTCTEVPGASTNASASICPKGWKIPTGGASGSNSQYEVLLNGLTVYDITAAPYNFVHAGYLTNTGNIAGTNVGSVMGSGYYWTRSSEWTNLAYTLGFGSNGIGYGTNKYSRSSGQSVRCIAEETTYTYTISFANNSANNLTNLPAAITCTSKTPSCTITLPTTTPGNNLGGCGWFTGWEPTQDNTNWNDNPTYKAGASITVSSDTTLYGATGFLNYCI